MYNYSFYNPDRVTYFAETDYRNRRTPFGIKASDRTRHMYVIGKTGMGKSTLLENMAVQDIRNGEGLAFIDPHGGTAEKLLEYIPEHRLDDVVYFAPFDTDHPIGFNVMEDVGYDKRHLVANGLMSAFKKIWVDAWSARMEYILNNVLLALLEYPESTILSVNKMLVDKDYRKKVVDNVTDPSVKSFWVDEFAKYTDRYAQEATPAILNKVGQFVSNPLIRNIIGQPKSAFDVRDMMDNRKILIMNLSKGRMGEQNANLIGSMLVTKIYLGAMSRADVPSDVLAKLPNFYFYVDEFQSFANESFADILSEARKYKLNLLIAHQYVEQMPEEVRAAVFGNVGTMIVFRVGSFDAEIFEKEFAPRFTAEDIVNLGFAQIYLRLMIDGLSSQPFSAVTLPPIPPPEYVIKDDVITRSRTHFARPREEVEHQIREWHEESHAPPPKERPRPAAQKVSEPAPSRGRSERNGNDQPRYSDQLRQQITEERGRVFDDRGNSDRDRRNLGQERRRTGERRTSREEPPASTYSKRPEPVPSEDLRRDDTSPSPAAAQPQEESVSLKEAILSAMTEKTMQVQQKEPEIPSTDHEKVHIDRRRSQEQEPKQEPKKEQRETSEPRTAVPPQEKPSLHRSEANATRPPAEEYSLKDALARAVQEHREKEEVKTKESERVTHRVYERKREATVRTERPRQANTYQNPQRNDRSERRHDRSADGRFPESEHTRRRASDRHEKTRSERSESDTATQRKPSHPNEIPKDVLERMLRVNGEEK